MSTKSTANPIVTKPIPVDKAQRAMELAEAGRSKRPASRQISANGKPSYYAPEGHRRLTVNVPEDLHRQLRQEAVDRDCTVTDIALERLRVTR